MRKVVLAAVLVLMAGGAQAATLNVIAGQLMGASGVLVDGSLYDVEFLVGPCAVMFNGCDHVSDFTFQTEASAILASQALLDQVFFDGPSGNFASVPALTNGCSGPDPQGSGRCHFFTPYEINPSGALFRVGVAANGIGGASGVSTRIWYPTSHLYVVLVGAVWGPSAIPEPSTALLLGLGLTGLAAKGRRRNRS